MSNGPWPSYKDRSGYTLFNSSLAKYPGLWRIEGTGHSWATCVRRVRAGEAVRIKTGMEEK